MADERRRLIYELLVEAKGMADTRKEMESIGKMGEKLGDTLKKAATGLAVTFTLKGIAEAISEANVMQSQLQTLGLTAQQSAQGLRMIEDISIATGQSMADTSQVMQVSIQMIQQLGGSLDDAARAAAAFTKIAASEGKTASEAAAQMSALNFAMQKGTLNHKEMIALLKSSNVLQAAAEEALGKTTQQLIEMAKQGKIGREQLEAVFDEMVAIGEQTQVPATLDGLTNSLTTMAKSVVNAAVNTAGLGTAASNVYGPLNVLANILRAVATTAGAVASAIFNTVKSVVQVGLAIAQAFADPAHLIEIIDIAFTQVQENAQNLDKALLDTRDAWAAVGTGAKSTGETLQNEHAAALRRADETQLAEDRRAKSLKDLADLSKELEDAVAAEQRAREQAARLAERRERERIDREQRARDDFARQLQANQEAQADLNAYLEQSAEDAGELAGQAIEASFAEILPEFEKALDASIGQIEEAADVLKGTFAELFAGGIRSAREFFAVLLQGLAQVFAQRAALQMSDWIDEGLGLLLKSLPSAAGAAGGGGGGSGVVGPRALGDAFHRGQALPFAAGGVVTRPTLFAMGGGQTGLMGEAGPEAVMPLKRTADGRLGVAAAAPSVQIVNNTGTAATGRIESHNDRLTIILEAAQMGANMAEARMNRSLRSGYGDTAQSMQRVYGLRRGGG